MRFHVASVALFAGAALATGYGETVYETKAVTITDCGPDVPDCPAHSSSHPATQAPTQQPSKSTKIVTVTSCPPGVECPGSPQPTGGAPSYSHPQQPHQPSSPGSQAPYPTAPQQPSTTVVTYTSCVPTVITETHTFTPSEAPTMPNPTQPQPQPTTPKSSPVAPTGGMTPPQNPSGSPTPPPYTGAAGSFGVSYAMAGIAAVAGFFLA